MNASDELRADFVELLLAYLEGTKANHLEWPPQPAEGGQKTPIAPAHEIAFLWEIVVHARWLQSSLRGADG